MLRNTTPTDVEKRKSHLALLSVFKPVKPESEIAIGATPLRKWLDTRQESKSSPLTTTPSPSLDLLK